MLCHLIELFSQLFSQNIYSASDVIVFKRLWLLNLWKLNFWSLHSFTACVNGKIFLAFGSIELFARRREVLPYWWMHKFFSRLISDSIRIMVGISCRRINLISFLLFFREKIIIALVPFVFGGVLQLDGRFILCFHAFFFLF